jgi:hypothetical protein
MPFAVKPAILPDIIMITTFISSARNAAKPSA